MGWFDTQELTAQARVLAEEYARTRASGLATGTAPDKLKRRYDKVPRARWATPPASA